MKMKQRTVLRTTSMKYERVFTSKVPQVSEKSPKPY